MFHKNLVLVLCFILSSVIATSAQRDTTVHIIMETSRPAELIKKEFPFDIDLKDADGQIFNSSNLFKKNKKATVLIFWMTTCGPCRSELNAISKKMTQWKKQVDFDLYAVSTDFPHQTEQFNTRVKQSNWPFPAYLDLNREFHYVLAGGLNGLPQLFVFDKKGKVIYHTRRYWSGDEDDLFKALKAI